MLWSFVYVKKIKISCLVFGNKGMDNYSLMGKCNIFLYILEEKYAIYSIQLTKLANLKTLFYDNNTLITTSTFGNTIE